MTRRARIRRWWWRWIRRYRYELCHECGRPVGLVWSAPDDLWARLVGGHRTLGGTPAPGIRCIPCFDAAALNAHVLLRWTCGRDDSVVSRRLAEQIVQAYERTILFHDSQVSAALANAVAEYRRAYPG